jgi:hypothetical protein
LLEPFAVGLQSWANSLSWSLAVCIYFADLTRHQFASTEIYIASAEVTLLQSTTSGLDWADAFHALAPTGVVLQAGSRIFLAQKREMKGGDLQKLTPLFAND